MLKPYKYVYYFCHFDTIKLTNSFYYLFKEFYLQRIKYCFNNLSITDTKIYSLMINHYN
jgi:hypothetical protein